MGGPATRRSAGNRADTHEELEHEEHAGHSRQRAMGPQEGMYSACLTISQRGKHDLTDLQNTGPRANIRMPDGVDEMVWKDSLRLHHD